MGAIRLEQVTKSFDGTVVIPCVDLEMADGELWFLSVRQVAGSPLYCA